MYYKYIVVFVKLNFINSFFKINTLNGGHVEISSKLHLNSSLKQSGNVFFSKNRYYQNLKVL